MPQLIVTVARSYETKAKAVVEAALGQLAPGGALRLDNDGQPIGWLWELEHGHALAAVHALREQLGQHLIDAEIVEA